MSKTSMRSWVTLRTQYKPDYFASNYLFGNKETVLASSDGDKSTAVGMCSYITMLIHINGNEKTVGYLGELRVLPEYRNKLHVLRNGFKAVRLLSQRDGKITEWYTSIASDNHVARRILEAGLRGLPNYQPLAEMLTFAIPAKGSQKKSLFRSANTDDIPEIARFYNQQAKKYQYSPVLTEEWLNSLDSENGLGIKDFYILKDGNSIQACFVLWDQRNIKQTVVCDYRFPLNKLRRIYNLFARSTGRVVLPTVGQSINYIFIAFLAIDESMKSEFKNMISYALALILSRGADIAVLGLSERNPLNRELDPFQKETYRTCIERVIWQDSLKTGSDGNQIDERPVQPEIAIL